MDAKTISIVALVGLLAVLYWQRRVIFTWSAIGVFIVSYLIFVVIGGMALPWVLPYAKIWFSSFNLGLLDDRDIGAAIALVVGGLGLVLLFYHLFHVIFTRRLIIRAPNLPFLNPPRTVSSTSLRLLIFSAVGLSCAAVLVLAHLGDFIFGLKEGILNNQPDLVIQARRSITDSYAFVILVFNVVPFYAVSLWVYYRIKKGSLVFSYAVIYSICAAILLLSVFQKRPVIIFLICMLLAHSVTSRRSIHYVATIRRVFGWKRIKRFGKPILYGGGLFIFLMALYFAQTQIGRQGESVTQTLQKLASAAITRILGRLSLSPALYVHYFPGVEPHYGIRNLGLLSKIFGFDLYPDVSRVFAYYTGGQQGNSAIPTLMDFYGGFGVKGWFIGTILLGLILERLDTILKHLKADANNSVFVIFMLVFVYYLSQANLGRSLLTYGGAAFVILWLTLTLKIHIVPQPTHTFTQAPESSGRQ